MRRSLLLNLVLMCVYVFITSGRKLFPQDQVVIQHNTHLIEAKGNRREIRASASDTPATVCPDSSIQVLKTLAHLYKFSARSGVDIVWPLNSLKERLSLLETNALSSQTCDKLQLMMKKYEEKIKIAIENSIQHTAGNSLRVENAQTAALISEMRENLLASSSSETENVWIKILFQGINGSSVVLHQMQDYYDATWARDIPLEIVNAESGERMGILYSMEGVENIDPRLKKFVNTLFQLSRPK